LTTVLKVIMGRFLEKKKYHAQNHYMDPNKENVCNTVLEVEKTILGYDN
jgi:hypothetical protein